MRNWGAEKMEQVCADAKVLVYVRAGGAGREGCALLWLSRSALAACLRTAHLGHGEDGASRFTCSQAGMYALRRVGGHCLQFYTVCTCREGGAGVL